MAKDLNKIMIIGRLGQDPESKFLTNGDMVCKFSVACSDDYKDKSGEKVQQTDWHNVEAWGKLGEICAEYLTKGKQVFIEGQSKTRKYDKDGITMYATSIKAFNMQMLGNKDGDNG